MYVKAKFLNSDLEEEILPTQAEGFVDPEEPHFFCGLRKAA